MKKIILSVLIGLMVLGAGIANANGLTMKEGDKTIVNCKFINLDTCYYDIDCIDYEKIKDSDYCHRNHYQDSAIYRPIKKNNIDIKIYDPEPCYDTSCGNCTNDQIKYNGKCLQKNEYCNEKFGSNAQWSDSVKDCACQSNYEWNKNKMSCIPAKVASTPTSKNTVIPAPLTRDQILAKVQEIMALIADLQKQLAAMKK